MTDHLDSTHSQAKAQGPQDTQSGTTRRPHSFWLLPTLLILLIVAGTVLLLTPSATPQVLDAVPDRNVSAGEPITVSEALFTATSAVCLTGLTVRDTARDFTPFGQTVIAFLIQLGALCIITFGTILALRLSQSMDSHEPSTWLDQDHEPPRRQTFRLIGFIILTTIMIELIGAALMYPLWADPAGAAHTSMQRVGMSFFHAMSAFCNAGFDLTGHSLVNHRFALLTHAVVLPLIVVGGLGYPVLANLFNILRARLKQRLRDTSCGVESKLNTHTKMVLATTACLYLLGVVTIGAGQLTPHMHESMQLGVTAHADSPEPLTMTSFGGVLADASFMSITSRTAGFNAMPVDELQPAGRFSVMMLMLAGGSPGSAAGGVKTIFIALLVLSTIATIRKRTQAQSFGCVLAGPLIRGALALGICYLLLVVVSTLLLCLSEPFTFQSLLFEAVSASTNTGLSLGVTQDLTGFGRGVVLLTMFLGRVGPLMLLGRLIYTQSEAVSAGAGGADLRRPGAIWRSGTG